MREKLKSWLSSDHVFYSLLVILVGFGGFVLGGGSVLLTPEKAVSNPELVAVTEPKVVQATATLPALVPEGVVVGSKTGTKYHLPSCPGASQIKPENRIEFATAAMATAAGYKPAANCPGLVQ